MLLPTLESRKCPPKSQSIESEFGECHIGVYAPVLLHNFPTHPVRRSMSLPTITMQVGNEFGQVEGLWSQFENVMAKEPEESKPENAS